MKNLFENQINLHTIKQLQIQVQENNRTQHFTVNQINTSHRANQLKTLLSKFGVNKRDIFITKKQNFNKITSTKNLMRQATGRMMDLEEFTLKFHIKYVAENKGTEIE